MIEHEILGQVVIECTDEEARLLWQRKPELRANIWTTEEFTAHILDDPAQVRACLSRKRAQPGRIR